MALLSVGLVFDLLGSHPPGAGDPPDVDAEYEPEETVALLEAALARLGHEAVRLGGAHDLLALASGRAFSNAAAVEPGEAEAGASGETARSSRAGRRPAGLPRPDVALNIAEGRRTRNREAWAPVLLEMLGIPCLGSDALTLSASLDKVWARRLVVAAGVSAPAQASVDGADAARAMELPASFPLFVKPRWEGTSKGIRKTSRVEDRDSLVAEVDRICRDYRQPAVVEAFLSGPEYTVTVVGNDPPRVLPVLQRALESTTRIGLHALEGAGAPASPGGVPLAHCLPGELTPALEAELADLALDAYAAFECLDFARADFRLDDAGRPHFLEQNPLPTFAPDGTFGILAELEGRTAEELLADVLGAGLQRMGWT